MKNIFTVIFLALAAYATITNHYGASLIALGMVALTQYAAWKFKREDELTKQDETLKMNFMYSSEAMLDIYECECSAGLVYNPTRDMQVAE